jgi:hypothetical protein
MALPACSGRLDAVPADATATEETFAPGSDVQFVIDTATDDTSVVDASSFAPFGEACAATTFAACAPSSRDTVYDVTTLFGPSARIVSAWSFGALVEPLAVVLFSPSGGPLPITIPDPGRGVALDGLFVLTCDDVECRAYEIDRKKDGGTPVRLPGAPPKNTRAVRASETAALFAGEGVRRWYGGAWKVDIAEGSFRAVDGVADPSGPYVVGGDNGLVVFRDLYGAHPVPTGTTESILFVGRSSEGIAAVTKSGKLLFGDEKGLAPCSFGGLRIASMSMPGYHPDRMVGVTMEGRLFAVGRDARICVENDPVADTRSAIGWSCGPSTDHRLTVTPTRVLGAPRCLFD